MFNLDDFGKRVSGAWHDAKTPKDKRLAATYMAFSTLFDFKDEVSLDHEDQVSLAKEIGVIAGMSESAEDFTKRFGVFLKDDLELNVE